MTDYYSRSGLSFHQLKDLATVSPSYYQRRHVTGELKDGDKESMRLGRLGHLAVLEPAKFDLLPTVPAEHLTPSGGLSTKAATKAWLESLSNRDFGTPDELALCRRLADAVRSHPEAADLLADGEVEQELFREVNGIACKGKADLLTSDSRQVQVWDFKTTRSLDGIARECREYGYCEQIAWYADLFNVEPGGLIVVEKEEPHRVLIVKFAPDAIASARARVAGWLSLYRQCLDAGEWPNNPPKPLILTAAALAAA